MAGAFITKFGAALIGDSKAVQHVGKGVGKLLGGMGGALDTLGYDLVESQRIRHETRRLGEQQAFLLRRQTERAAQRESAAQGDFVREREAAAQRALLKAEARDQKHRHELERRTHEVQTELHRLVESDRTGRQLANSPFQYDGDRLRADALRESDGGTQPVLLIAPFVADPFDGRLDEDVHHCWGRIGRQDRMGRLSGTFRRPLHLLDTDVHTVAGALPDVPVVLVSGEFDDCRRLWVSIAAWNLIEKPGEPGRIHRLTVPPATVPGRRGVPAFRNDVTVGAVFLAELLAEWFHVARGAVPAMYRDVPVELRDEVAFGSAAMLDVAAARELLDPLDALLAQARVYLDVRRAELARAALDRVYADLLATDRRQPPFYLDRVRTARTLLHEAGLHEAAERLAADAGPTARAEYLNRMMPGGV